MKLIIFLPIIFLCGCFRIATPTQDKLAAQSVADSIAAAKFIRDTTTDESIKLAANAIYGHSLNIAKALEIDPEDLPNARVSKVDWIIDPAGSDQRSQENIKKDGYSLAQIVTATSLATMLAGVGLAMGRSMLAAHPLGQLLGYVGTLFGQATPVKEKAHRKLLIVLDEYKKLDPNWKDNKLYQMLSDRMTNAEKDYVKRVRDELG